jgi:hypothetical protein
MEGEAGLYVVNGSAGSHDTRAFAFTTYAKLPGISNASLLRQVSGYVERELVYEMGRVMYK